MATPRISSSSEPRRSSDRSFIDVEMRDLSLERAENHHPPNTGLLPSNDWRRFFRIGTWRHTSSCSDYDAVEILLAEAVSSTTHDSTSLHHYKRLQSQYARFKRLPAEWRPSKNRIASCNQLFSHWSLSSPEELQSNKVHNHQTQIRTREHTVSDWLLEVISILNAPDPDGLQLIAIAATFSSDDIRNFVSFWTSTIATFRGNLTKLSLVPSWLVNAALTSCWHIDIDPLHDCYLEDHNDLIRPQPLLPPSMRSLATPGSTETRIMWGSNVKGLGNMDPTRGENEIHLTWRQKVTTFTSDFNVYIWEQQKSWPLAEHAKVIFSPAMGINKADRLLVSFNNCRSLATFTKKRNAAAVPGDNTTLAGAVGQDGHSSWSCTDEVVISLLCLFEVMIADTAEFLGACHDEAKKMNILGRREPSTSKLRFLMHLEDCRQVGHNGVKHGLNVLQTLSQWTEQHLRSSNTFPPAFIEPFAKVRADLEFEDQEFLRLETHIRGDLEMIRRHFQLAQDLTLFRLTILAGIFLPLSFATSLFGMNMNASSGPPGPIAMGFSNWTNATIENLPPDVLNQTQAIISTLDSNSEATQSYTWPTFVGASVGLVLILPLTLAIGSIARVIIVSTTRYAIYWRIFTIFGPILGMLFIACSVWGTLISGFAFLSCNLLLLAAEILQTYRAWTTKQRPVFWASLLLLTVSCLAIDLTVLAEFGNDSLMLLPWLFLGIDMLLRSGFWRSMKRKALERVDYARRGHASK